MKIFGFRCGGQGSVADLRIPFQTQPVAAGSLAREINSKFGNLSRFLFIGRERTSLGPGLRSIVAGAYVIFYTVDPDRIAIVRILHGHRDIDAEFQR